MPRRTLTAATLSLIAILAALLAACATPVDDPKLSPGRSTVAELQALYGAPTRVWPEADGGQTLEYASQPFGTHCYLLRFDAAGRLTDRRDGLAPAERARVVTGMRIEQVQRLLGTERSRTHYARSHEDVWDWNVEPPYAATWLRFNVHFKDGVVVQTSEILIDPDRTRRSF